MLHHGTTEKGKFEWTEKIWGANFLPKDKMTSPSVLSFPDFNRQFIVEIDASDVLVGVVLAQERAYERVHPVQFVSRTMKKEENKYFSCEKEALDMIFTLRKFRVFLLSSMSFKLVTDHEFPRHAF